MPSVEDDSDLVLHERLLHGDPTAFAKIAERYLPLLVKYLTKRFRVPDQHLLETAAEDALLTYNEHPERFDSTRIPLSRYLAMSARGDLLNALHQQKKSFPFVELDDDSAEYLVEIPDEQNVQHQVMGQLSPIYARLRQVLGATARCTYGGNDFG
ncbi:MAG TPA: sigma factor [Anaerolineae bacterium]|nr:sigma factor [Anaerolineae bacterium]